MDDTILLVDDEAGIRKVLGISLADHGYNVHTAENGRDALRIFRKIHPPIVLTDIKMPDMDGIELLRRIKKENADTEVIMFTGQGDMDLAIQCLKNDATDFVTKPIDDEVLGIAIQRARERFTMREQIKQYTQNLEELVAEKAQKLVEAERMAAIGQTIAGLSHTIKNIAGSLRGSIFVMGQGIDLDNKKYLTEGWEMIRGNVDKIRSLSLDLLNYGKYTELNLTLSDPNSPVRDVLELVQSRADAAGVELLVELSHSLKPFFFDPEAIHQCLLNLMTNAIDACAMKSAKDVQKQVQIKTGRKDGWAVEYKVTDTGIGMDDDIRQKIFQSFFSTKGTHGTGIGLMMTKKIIDRHGGKIRVESEVGNGSTFRVCLPERHNAD